MKIGLDLDNVVIDWDGGVRRFWNHTHVRQIPPQSTHWDAPFEDTGLTPQEFWMWIDRNGVYESLSPCDGALDAIARLEEDHEIHFITNRHHRGRVTTVRWLTEHNLDQQLHFVKDKSTVRMNLYVDDHQEVLEGLLRNVPPSTCVVRMIRPWNHHVSGLSAVDSLGEVW